MKYLTTHEFNKKLGALNSVELIEVGNVVHYLQNNDKELIYQSATLLANEDIYTIGSKEATVYFTMGSDDSGDYLLLLDFTVVSTSGLQKQKEFFALRDPKTNQSLNPNYNRSINPNFNRSINPNFNRTINPNFNRTINPNFNRTINPNFNRSINPNFNRSINPNFNRSINPNFNRSINPKFNKGFGGPFIYSLDLTQEGYMIQANDKVFLLFNTSTELIGIGVKHSQDMIILFNNQNQPTGNLIPTSNKVYLRFDDNANWTGIVV